MIKKYRISKKAINDLERIWLYTCKKWSIEEADRYHTLIIDEIEYISLNFASCRKIDHIRLGYRMSKVKYHLIFFKVIDNNSIEIIRILHQSMDIENKLAGNK